MIGGDSRKLIVPRGIRVEKTLPGLLEKTRKATRVAGEKKTTYPGGWKTRKATRVGGKRAISYQSQHDDHKVEYSSPVHRIRIVGIAGITPRARYDAYSSMTVQQVDLFVET